MNRTLVFYLLSVVLPLQAEAQEAILYAPFDGTTTATTRSFAQPNVYSHPFLRPEVPYQKGIRGKAALLGDGPHGGRVVYPVVGNIDPVRGTVLFWMRRASAGSPEDEGLSPVSENLLPAKAAKMLQDALSDGRWHHVASSWDTLTRAQTLLLDGETLDAWRRQEPVGGRTIAFGGGCTCLLDELVITDSPLPAGEVQAAFQAGKAGKRWLPGRKAPSGRDLLYPLRKIPRAGDRGQNPFDAPREDSVEASRENLKRVERSPNGIRQRYELGGFWRVRPVRPENPLPVSDSWWHVRVPGCWRGRNVSLLSPAGRLVTLLPTALAQSGAAWIERTFLPPDSEQPQRFRLVFDAIQSTGEGDYPSDVYLNGVYLGTMFDWERRVFDLTEGLESKKPNLIQVLNGRPWGEVEEAGIIGGCWLEACPAKPFLIDEPIFVRAAVDQKALGVEFGFTDGKPPRDCQVWCRVDPLDESAPEETLGPVAPKDLGGGLFSAWFTWARAETWTPDSPRLFRLSLLVRGGDQVLDETFDVRFGFRELAIAGDALLLNGNRLQIRANRRSGPRESAGEVLEQDRRLGFNAAALVQPSMEWAEELLDQADAAGHCVLFPLSPTPSAFLTGPNAEQARRYFAARMDRLANHPSLILWQIEDEGFVNGPHGHPMTVGAAVKAEKGHPAWRVSETLHEIDPSRPNAYAWLGLGGDIRSVFQPFGPDVPLQTQEEWPRAWALTRPQPLLVSGDGPMPLRHFFLWQREPARRFPALAEHAARYLGGAAYRKVTPADAPTLSQAGNDVQSYWEQHPVYGDLRALAFERLLKAWRAFGVSYIFQTCQMPSPEVGRQEAPGCEKALARYNGPLTAYITGPAASFVARDHAYFSGETIEKQIVMVNDSCQAIVAKVGFEWSSAQGILLEGQKGTQSASLGPGQTAGIPIKADAPAAVDKTPLSLSVQVRFVGVDSAARPAPIEDSMTFQVFPRFRLPPNLRPQRILIADPEGAFKAILKAEEVPFAELAEGTGLGSYDLLVLARGSADEETLRRLHELKLPEAVEAGLNVLCFEQPLSEVLGLRLETFDNRQAFVRSGDYPLLQGLSDDDFADWRGETTIRPSYPAFDPNSDWRSESYLKHGRPNALGQRRFWHWSNLGTVAAFCFRKPQRGNFRVLLDCGFDLLYTPLVEIQAGLGRILLCQLDVTGRYAMDPVATLLVQRMVAQYAYRGESALRTALAVVGKPGRELLYALGCPTEDFLAMKPETVDLRRPLVLDLRDRHPLNPQEVQRIQDFVALGGRLLQVGASSPQDKAWLPGDMRFAARSVFRTEVPSMPELSGLGDSDFFWRQPQVLPVVAEVPPRGTIIDSGVLAVVPFGRGKAVLCQFDPSLFKDSWQRTKAFRVLSMLLTNLGARSDVRPWPARDDQPAHLGLYVEDALDFDPDEHYLFEP